MISPRPAGYYADLTRKLCQLPKETEWVGFKRDRAIPQDIGKHISALSNSAACNGKPSGYIFWGVEGDTHRITGTTFRPETKKTGNEPLETWLLRLLEPQVRFGFHSVDINGKRVVILEVERAPNQPVSFGGTEYIRVGEVKKPLRDASGRERELWRTFDRERFAELITAGNVDGEEVLRLLSHSTYFSLLKLPRLQNCRDILEALSENDLIRPCPAGGWDITNLGALLLAEKFDHFPDIRGKAMRVTRYRGMGRSEATRKYVSSRGYANGFTDLIDHAAALLPRQKMIKGADRKKIRTSLVAAMRELVANALIHQDFTAGGAGPTLEIFANRIEVTNPGEPLAGTDRLLDTLPRSRNESLALLMRRFGYCEERGSGIERVVKQMKEVQLPAPRFEARCGFTRAIVFSH